MYTNEFCGLRIRIPEDKRTSEAEFQEAKQKLEDILHYASYCAQSTHNKEQKNVNLLIRDNGDNRIFLSIFANNTDIYAAKYEYNKKTKTGSLMSEIEIKDIHMVNQLTAENRIHNYIQMQEKSYSYGYGLETVWKEYVGRFTAERENTKEIHYNEYAKMDHLPAKRNVERKFPVQQNRISTFKRSPSPSVALHRSTAGSSEYCKPEDKFLCLSAASQQKKNFMPAAASKNETQLKSDNPNLNTLCSQDTARKTENLVMSVNTEKNKIIKQRERGSKLDDPDTVRRDQFLKMIKSGNPAAIKKYMDTVTKYAKQQNLVTKQRSLQTNLKTAEKTVR